METIETIETNNLVTATGGCCVPACPPPCAPVCCPPPCAPVCGRPSGGPRWEYSRGYAAYGPAYAPMASRWAPARGPGYRRFY